LNISKLAKQKTEYKSIAISSALLFALLILLFVVEIFVFWGIYGEGATASRISELWYVEIFLDYFPIVLIGSYLMFKTYTNYKNQSMLNPKRT
jgi:hypothetical protein